VTDVKLSPETFARLQAHAVPLVDTIESVMNRALDALDTISRAKDGGASSSSIRVLDPAAPPSLSFTTVKAVVVGQRRLPPAETYWNWALEAVIKAAADLGKTPEELCNLLIGNSLVGAKEDGGYKHLPEAGISYQRMDANSAWRATFHIADLLKIEVDVTFVWQDSPKAAFPGVTGRLTV